MKLFLVRHGQTASNVAHRLDTGVPGPGLTDLGAAQAAALVDLLAGHRVDAVYSSAHRRAQLTAAPLAAARGLAVQVRPGLGEVTAGDLEMRDDDASARRYLGVIFDWAHGRLDVPMPGGETGPAALARIDAVVAEAATGSRSPVLVSHGGAIRMWVAARSDVSVDFAAAHPLANTGVVELDGEPGSGWSVRSWTGAVLGETGGGLVLDSAPARPLEDHAAGRPRGRAQG